MKKVRCPKCNSYTVFDETRYQPGQRLVFVCSQCNKQFAIKTPSNSPLQGEKAGELTAKEALPLREGLGGSVGSVGVVVFYGCSAFFPTSPLMSLRVAPTSIFLERLRVLGSVCVSGWKMMRRPRTCSAAE